MKRFKHVWLNSRGVKNHNIKVHYDVFWPVCVLALVYKNLYTENFFDFMPIIFMQKAGISSCPPNRNFDRFSARMQGGHGLDHAVSWD